MKRLALLLLVVGVVTAIAALREPGEPMRAGDYARQYGGSHGTYAGILRDTRCERLWELHLLDVPPGYRIAAADRYNDICT